MALCLLHICYGKNTAGTALHWHWCSCQAAPASLNDVHSLTYATSRAAMIGACGSEPCSHHVHLREDIGTTRYAPDLRRYVGCV